MARNIMAALAQNLIGFGVDLASNLRCYDGQGDASVQQQIRQRADAEIDRLTVVGKNRNWLAWVTYHNYYRAPDLIGPAVSRYLNIPYILIEASIAKRRLTGPWSGFAASADTASSHADIIFYLTQRDRFALERHRPEGQKISYLRPFLNQTDLPVTDRLYPTGKKLLSVGMHRKGDKFSSYQIIADLLPHLQTPGWQLSVVGDGPARAEVEALFAAFADKVSFLGQLERQALSAAYAQASVFAWPGVNEAFGMVYLEAQAVGLPVVAQDRPGVCEVVGPHQSLVSDQDPEAMARAIDAIFASPQKWSAMSREGQAFVRYFHLLPAAAHTLSEHLVELLKS